MSRNQGLKVLPARSTPSPRPVSTLSRAKSLRIPPKIPLHIPIPPSLAQSPLLYSPQSIFRRAASTPRLPSEEDERWLGDTVPLSPLDGRKGKSPITERARSPLSEKSEPSSAGDEDGFVRGRTPDVRVLHLAVPSSPPIIPWRIKPVTSQASPKRWSDPGMTLTSRSEPNANEAGKSYFEVAES